MPERLADDRLRYLRGNVLVTIEESAMATELLELRQRVAKLEPQHNRYREALEELARPGCISGHRHERCWDCYKHVRDWCHPCVAPQYALDPWTDREATA